MEPLRALFASDLSH